MAADVGRGSGVLVAAHAEAEYSMDHFDAVPNAAYRDPNRPWLVYHTPEGGHYQLLPDGKVVVYHSGEVREWSTIDVHN